MATMTLPIPYRARAIAPLEPWTIGAWRLKVYAINHADRGHIAPALIEGARAITERRLATASVDGEHRVGYVMLHQARIANYLLVTWWGSDNTVFQATFTSPIDQPAALVDIGASGQVACVWEMAVHAFEREAWLATVLQNPPGPDLDAYLARLLTACV